MRLAWSTVTGMIVAGVCASPALAQQVRVMAPEVAVRLAASTESLVLTTVPAGTVLEVHSRLGEWVAVLLAPDGQGIRRLGYIPARLTEDVPVQSHMSTPEARLAPYVRPGSTVGSGTAIAAAGATAWPEWQVRYDLAVQLKESGKSKINMSWFTWAGSVALMVYSKMHKEPDWSTYQCGYVNCYVEYKERPELQVGYWGLLGVSTVLSSWGSSQVGSANRQLAALELERKAVLGRVAPVAGQRLSARMLLRETSVAVRLTW